MEKLVQASETRILPRSARSYPVYLLSGELQLIRDLESLTQQQLADILGVNVKRVSRWEKKPELIPRPVVKVIGLKYSESFMKIIPLDRFRNQLYSLLLTNVRRQWNLKQDLMAQILSIDKKTFSRYERGLANIPDRIREFTMKACEEKTRLKPKSQMENNR